MAKVNLIFYGYLKKLYPEGITLTGDTVAELINGLCLQTNKLNPKLGDPKHCLRIKGFDSEESLFAQLPEDFSELHIVPDLSGAKNGGFLQIVIGAILVVAGIIVSGLSFGTASAVGAALIGVGIGMIVGGAMQILSPAPELDTTSAAQDPEASKYLLASQNTTKIGTRIPLLYGKSLCFGHYLSFNIDAKDISV